MTYQVPSRGPMGLKQPKPTKAEGKRHMAMVAQLSCLICYSRPVEVHHCCIGRFGTRKATDLEVIPLCPSCHRTGPDAIHRDKAAWERRHGSDFDMLPLVDELLNGSIDF